MKYFSDRFLLDQQKYLDKGIFNKCLADPYAFTEFDDLFASKHLLAANLVIYVFFSLPKVPINLMQT